MESQQLVRVLVTGGTGLVGSNIREVVENLKNQVKPSENQEQQPITIISVDEAATILQEKQDNASLDQFLSAHAHNHEYIYLSSKDCNLINIEEVNQTFEKYQPTYVIHLAAKVGGLYANMNAKVQFFEDNLLINMNIIKCSHKFGVKRLICVLSTCVFPDRVSYPIQESDLHQGAPHHSNEGYAFAKRMCSVQCQLYNEQYGTDFQCVIPTNIYGKYDQYNESSSHLVPALVRKAHFAREENKEFVVLGTGAPLRQFCYAPDLAKLLLWTLYRKETLPLIALVPEEEYTIKEVAETIAELSGVQDIVYDTSKSDGQYKKTMGNQLFRSQFKNFKFTELREGLKITIDNFKNEKRL
eukprot:403369615